MKKILLIVAFASSISFLVSCKNSANDDPKNVLINFFDALGKKNIEEAKKLATPEAKTLLDKMAHMFDTSKSSTEPNSFERSNLEFGDEKIEGDSATIPVKFKDLGQTAITNLKKEKEGWKVDLNLEFMMQLIADHPKETGIDSLSLEDMKNINIDSFDAAMKKGLPAADSLLKKMNAQ